MMETNYQDLSGGGISFIDLAITLDDLIEAAKKSDENEFQKILNT